MVLRLLEAAARQLLPPGSPMAVAGVATPREHLADSLAVRLTGDPLALARAVEPWPGSRLESRSVSARRALGGETSTLPPRIQEILGMMPHTPAFPSGRSRPSPAVDLALVTASLGFSQDPPAATPAPTPSQPATQLPARAPAPRPGGEPQPPMITFEMRMIQPVRTDWR